ncbi:MAG: hypothetical protein JXA13_13105 [Anaerolineales bacterium]|nr:hypothetical protein [Anaerolineales bacterium]
MHIGMLWYDNDSKTTLPIKVQKAVDYYCNKYGHKPNLCLVHPSMIEITASSPENNYEISIRPYPPILPGHLWIGIEDKLAITGDG